ncbi:MAG TPA: NAD(P)-dependent oxidoreductase [Chthoniobacter sp.]|jgi:3-hydroxyisobutyrate dehydrogenase-like beta-hydroxyacid dehydrogenase
MSRKVRKNVGVIGLGIIGSRVAAGLRAAGYQVYVWNRSAKPAPNFLGSPAEIAESAEIIQIFVSDAQALFDVVEAMSETLTPKHVIVCNSTVGPEAVLEAAQLIEARGAQFLDAPFTGSKVAAEKRQLVYYVGGSEQAFVRARPILELTSKNIIRMGEVGHASTIKVVTNMISGVTIQVLAEALSIVQKAGIEPEMLVSAIEQNACRSGVIDLKLPKMMAGDYEPHFSLKHMFKDVQLGIHMANALDIEIPATTVTAGVMYGALNQGWGDLDFSALFKNYAPAEIFEELPALDHVLGQGGPESLEAGGEPPIVQPLPLALNTTAEPSAGQTNVEPIPVVAPEKSELPVEATSVAFAGVNGSPVRETVPSEEAARIIEAVLTHVAGQRGDMGAMPQFVRHIAPVTQPSEKVVLPAEGKSMEEETGTVSTGALEKVAEVKVADGAQVAPGESKLDKKQNFVRRWFVGRAQS